MSIHIFACGALVARDGSRLDISLTRHIDTDPDRRALANRSIAFAHEIGSTPQGVYVPSSSWFILAQSVVTKTNQGFIWLGVLLSASACTGGNRAASSGACAAPARAMPSASANAAPAASATRPNKPAAEPLRSPLLIAAAAGDLATIKKLVAEHADVAAREDGRSAIELAAQGGHYETVTFLLDQKVPPAQSELALVIASGAGDIALMEALLDKQVSPNAHDEHGISPLILSGYAGKLEAVELLLARGADPNQVNEDREAPLHTCAVTPRAEQIVPLLLKKGARVDLVDRHGRIPLNNHAHAGNTAAVRALLNAGSALEHRDRDQQTPLMSAAIRGHDATVTELLARHADPNTTNGFGATPLMAAAAGGHLGVVQRLSAAGATLNQRLIDKGQTALDLALENDHVEVVTWLLDHGMDSRGRATDRTVPLMLAAYKNSAKSIPVLIAHGADPNLLVAVGGTASLSPLMGACANDHEPAARALLDGGANVNLTGKGGASALHLAAISGSLPCVQLLLARGAIVDARNDANGTPLRSASEAGHLAIVKLLLSRGAKPNIADTMGLLPIDYARKGGHTAVVAALSAAK